MTKRSNGIHNVILWTLSLIVALVVLAVLWQGRDYYRTPLADRPHHELFRELRPAGRIGHGLGIVGSAMVLLLLLYSLRKRWKPLARLGQLRHWLRYHIFLGTAGPILITLHTSGKVDGLVAVSYWSMAAVALSGVFGRYLYQQIPRNVLGEAMAPAAVEERNEAILVDLADRFGADQRCLDALDKLALGQLQGKPAPVALLNLPFVNIMLARRLQKWIRAYRLPDAPEVRLLAKQWVLATRRLHLFHLVRDLFHWWHVFHKPFAIIMILVMVVHVGVALALGYTWVFAPES
ncbi:MAG TPA: hypothetical protein PK625_08605 [Spirochaetales bacterium]|nr:hypothetical protein [Spirochaetales bacterium]